MRSELATGTVKLQVERSGEGDTAVVLLHGLFGSSSNLMAVAKALTPYFTVLRMDLRNHGKSGHSETMDLPRMAEDVLAAMDALEIGRCHLLGHSLGGKVAMQLALRHPERVMRLVVADIAPVAYGRDHDTILTALQGLDLRALESREQADKLLGKAVPEVAVRQFLLKNLQRSDEGWVWRMNLPVIAQRYDNLRQAPEEGIFEGPTLFIRGELSRYILDEYRVGMQRRFPNMGLETLAGAGHWLHAEQAQRFNDVVTRFLCSGGDI